MKYYVENLDKVLNELQNQSDKALLYCWEYLADKFKEEVSKDSYDTGQLARSITYMKDKDWVLVWTNLEYALVREYWRKPWKFPPLQALVGWSARKGMISWWATTRYDDLHYTDKGTIYVIARAIARNGIQGKHTFERVFNREKQNIIDLYTELINKWL